MLNYTSVKIKINILNLKITVKKMNIILTIIFSVLITLTFNTVSLFADSFNLSPLGFKFGMSDGNAKKQIKSNGHSIIKNEMDSKDVRTILFDGVVVDVTDIDGIEQNTRLEFFKNKLMSSALIIKTSDDLQFIDVQNDLLKYIVSAYGEPNATDNMLSYETWEWDVDNIALILSANRNKGKLKMEYTFNPVASAKLETERDKKRKGEYRNPADQMFKDGNFSKQGGPGLKYE
jgi:hypothetical protein